MSYYLVRLGEGSRYAQDARANGYIAIGWDLPNLKSLKSLESIKQKLRLQSPEISAGTLAAYAGQVARFAHKMEIGDTVLTPLGGREYLVGKIGEYYFEENPSGACPFKHRRHVEWQHETLSKDQMSTNLAYALGSSLTLFSLENYGAEIAALLSGETKFTPAEAPQSIRELIVDGLMSLNGKEFEEFIRHLLEVLGFRAETTPYTNDKGIDVNGILDAEGLAEIVLRVQAKRVSGTIGNKDVLALRGAAGQGEHTCLIALNGFTAAAEREADAAKKTPVRLIDGDDLAAIILKNFDQIDEKYRSLFPIRRRKDFDIEDQFEFSETMPEGTPQKPKYSAKSVGSNQDTIVCAAKADGFRRVFIGLGAWWAVRVSQKVIPHLKYIAMYQVAPVSAITHFGEIERFEPFEKSGKYKIILKGEPIKLSKPVMLGKNRFLKPQGAKYATMADIKKADSLDDVFGVH